MNKTFKYIFFYIFLILIWALFTHIWISEGSWLFNTKIDWNELTGFVYVLFCSTIIGIGIIAYLEQIFD